MDNTHDTADFELLTGADRHSGRRYPYGSVFDQQRGSLRVHGPRCQT